MVVYLSLVGVIAGPSAGLSGESSERIHETGAPVPTGKDPNGYTGAQHVMGDEVFQLRAA